MADLKSISSIERQFIDALPAQFQMGGYSSYKTWLIDQHFNNNIEAAKVKQAYMEAFITAVFMAQEESNAGRSLLHGRDVPQEERVLPLQGGAERETELPGGAPVGPSASL